MRVLAAGAAAAGAGLVLALPGAVPTSAKASAGVPGFRPRHALLDVGVHSAVRPAQAIAAARSRSSFPQYTATVTVGGHSYTYVMAGKNPAVQSADPAATITADLVPVVIKFANRDTWDPTQADSCDPGVSALARAQSSPVVTLHPWT
jgi:hypothetical protein